LFTKNTFRRNPSEQLKNEAFLKEDKLDFLGDGLEVIHHYFVEGNLDDFIQKQQN
jgi:hypothetical protein